VKKFLSILIALALILAFTVPAMAAQSETNVTTQTTVTSSGTAPVVVANGSNSSLRPGMMILLKQVSRLIRPAHISKTLFTRFGRSSGMHRVLGALMKSMPMSSIQTMMFQPLMIRIMILTASSNTRSD